MPPTPPLTLPELAELVLRDARDTRIIDLRAADEFDRAHIPCSSRLGADEIDLPYLRPPRRRRLALLAEDPALAASCALRLRENGYDARPLAVPISSWMGDWEGGPEGTPAWEPSRLVAEWAERLIGLPDAVDLGCGSGRDAVYLALRGFRVTAIDILPDAVAQGRLLAMRHGVGVAFICADLAQEPEAWKGPWGVINVQRFLDRGSLPLIRERLRESGYVLYDTFLDAQADEGRKPRNRAFLLKRGELRETAGRGLRVLEYREGRDDDGDWTASLVARRESPEAGLGDRSSPKRGG
jgi:SAM-dependent methyltransferase